MFLFEDLDFVAIRPKARLIKSVESEARLLTITIQIACKERVANVFK